MNRTKTKLLALTASATMLATTFSAIGVQAATQHRSSQGAPVYGGTLSLDLSGAFPHLDPVRAYDTTSYEGVLQLYDQLVTYKGNTNNIIGDLASSYSISKNGKVYTFHLHNAKFWNGDKVTANSFITEFERVLVSSNQSPFGAFINPLIVGSAAFASGHAKTISGLQSLNGGKTLQITLQTPSPTFLYILAMPFASAVDPSYVKAHPEAYIDYHPMGTGPFELTSYKPGEQWIFTKNPHYFVKGIPYLNKIIFTNNNSPQAVLLHFEQGSTGLIAWNQGGNGIPSQDYLPLTTSPQYSKDLFRQVLVATNYIGLNTKYGPTAKVAVRRALEYAVNKNQLLRILDGRAIAANQVIPPSMPSGYETKLPADASYNYNPTLAKALLKKAGYPHGFTTTIYTDNSNPDDVRIAQAVQQDFGAIGVTLKINQASWGPFLTNNETGKQPTFVLAWLEDYPDPSDFLNTLFNSNQAPVNNSTNFNNPVVDKLLNQAANMPNTPARFAKYKQAQNIIMKNAVWIPYAYPVFTAAVQPWVKNYYLNPNLVDPLQYIWVTKH